MPILRKWIYVLFIIFACAFLMELVDKGWLGGILNLPNNETTYRFYFVALGVLTLVFLWCIVVRRKYLREMYSAEVEEDRRLIMLCDAINHPRCVEKTREFVQSERYMRSRIFDHEDNNITIESYSGKYSEMLFRAEDGTLLYYVVDHDAGWNREIIAVIEVAFLKKENVTDGYNLAAELLFSYVNGFGSYFVFYQGRSKLLNENYPRDCAGIEWEMKG